MDQQKAYEEIHTRLAKVMEMLEECKTIANEAQVEFDFKPAYGMGGTYYPVPKGTSEDDMDEYGWYSSTRSCQGW